MFFCCKTAFGDVNSMLLLVILEVPLKMTVISRPSLPSLPMVQSVDRTGQGGDEGLKGASQGQVEKGYQRVETLSIHPYPLLHF